jgi:bifunctional UDP-N-acetylglucosamine pyrophosphorylase/glucosamine-1-phosphate N-acetyltransferase
MVDWVVESAHPLKPEPLVVVVSPDTHHAFSGFTTAVQDPPLGTGDAVRCAREAVGDVDEVLVLSGDTPLLTTGLLEALLGEHRRKAAAATVLSFVPDEIRSYGRVVRDADGDVAAIVEAVDATPDQLALREANSSIYVFAAEALWPALDRLAPANAQGELYLTDAVRDLVGAGRRVAVHVAPDPAETEGVNTRVELAAATATLRDRINEAHMLAGVTIIDPASTWIEPSVMIAADAVVYPFTVLRGTTRIAAGAQLGPHAVAVDAIIGERVLVGPFCYLRPGTVLGDDAKAGTFVELKNSVVGARSKVPHLSYVGDTDIGQDANIGAGTITANLDHGDRTKHRTVIGDNVRTGIDNALVAPVTIGDDAWIAAGSVITEDVPAGALAIARARQVNKEGRGGQRND